MKIIFLRDEAYFKNQGPSKPNEKKSDPLKRSRIEELKRMVIKKNINKIDQEPKKRKK